MQYRTLPNTDLQIPVLTLGTATFGGSHGFEGWGHVDVAEATRMVDISLEAGINMFDTADVFLQRPTIVSLVVGARTEAHLKQNLEAVSFTLTSEQVARLDAASRQPKAYPYWHQDLKPELKAQIFR